VDLVKRVHERVNRQNRVAVAATEDAILHSSDNGATFTVFQRIDNG
jgi:hypothetical protein